MPIRALTLSLLVLSLAAASAAPAAATVVPGRGMAGVRMGDCVDDVIAKLGKPEHFRKTSDFAGPGLAHTYTAKGLRTSFHFNGDCYFLTAISTSKGQERTAQGIGKGSQLASLRAKLTGEHCLRSHGRVRSCHLGAFTPGRVVTDFRIDSKGRVTSVLVGRVID